MRLAAWHRLTPVLFRHLAPRAAAPPEVLGKLEHAYLDNAARNLFVRAALQRALEALAAADVPAMLLKGAALVETVYPDPALREMSDLDVLVPAAEIDTANAALTAIGYGPVDAWMAGRRSQLWMRAHHHHDPALVDRDRIAAVELHHHLLGADDRSFFDIAGIWERSREAAVPPAHRLPATEDLLLHACLHFTLNRMHRGSRGSLAEVGDIARLAGNVQLDGDALIANVRAYRLQSRVFLALFAADELGFAVPARVLGGLRPPAFDARLGRRLIALRVLRVSDFSPRSLRRMVAPGREALALTWGADAADPRSLPRAYVRRLAAGLRQVRSALNEPWALIQDHRLIAKYDAFERRDFG